MNALSDVDPIPHNDARSEEIFLKHVGTFFEIDEEGRIWRIKKRINATKIVTCNPRVRAEEPATNGYLRVRMQIKGTRIHASAHRVVYRYFHGDIPKNAIINHKDADLGRWCNHPDNLEPKSQSYNVKHGRRWK